MSDVQASTDRRETFFNNWRFRLIPEFRYRPQDEQNCSSFHFHWLFFRAWSMMSPDIGLDFELSDNGFHVKARVPYLIFGVFLYVFPQGWHQKIWRKGTRRYS